MGVKKVITSKGLELLASSSEATGQNYWIGHYALAYVPNEWKETDDQISSSMTKLTTKGDMIWNIFQGDLNGNGYYDGKSDGSSGGNLFGLSMYNVNVKKHFRYLLDSDNKNTLVSWELDGSDVTNPNLMKGYHMYTGTDGTIDSKMPVPSPLYYMGDVTGGNSVDDFRSMFSDPRYNGSLVYPSIEYNINASDTISSPLVSNDPRGYLDYNGLASGPTSAGFFFDDEISPASSGDVTTWYDSASTLINTDSLTRYYADKFYQLHSISNYNRFHAPVGSIGNILNSQLKSRNIAKTTKLFPIANYQVINSEAGIALNGESREVATGIKLSIDLNLSPRNKTMGYLDGVYDETKDLTLQDNYENISANGQGSLYNTTHTSFKFNRLGIYAVPMRKAPYTNKTTNITGTKVDVQFEINPDVEPILFAVVDWEQAVYMSDTGDGLSNFSTDININLDSPTLDSSVIRDTAVFYNLYKDSSTTWYENQLIANAQTSHAITEIGLEVANLKNKQSSSDNCCTETNLDNKYASKDHTHEGLGLRNLRDANVSANGGLKAIDSLAEGEVVDGEIYSLGLNSVVLGKSTAAIADYSTIGGGTDNKMFPSSDYKLSSTSIINSFIGAGSGNTIKESKSFIGAGQDNTINDGELSFIGAGKLNVITDGVPGDGATSVDDTTFASILNGESNTIASPFTTILNGKLNIISAGINYSNIDNGQSNLVYSNYASILNGNSNKITGQVNGNYTTIANGNNNVIGRDASTLVPSYSFIVNGSGNLVEATHSGILSGLNNKIYDISSTSEFGASTITNSVILGGTDNKIRVEYGVSASVPTNNIIGGGQGNIIDGAQNSNGIFTGVSNNISSVAGVDMTGSVILSGFNNLLIGAGASSIVGGFGNLLASPPNTNSLYNTISGGSLNNINISNHSSILSAKSGVISSSDFSSIINGETQRIEFSTKSIILNGEDNTISNSYTSEILNGFGNSITGNPIVNVSDLSCFNNAILAGSNNSIKTDTLAGDISYNTIFNGYDNVVHGSNYISINGSSNYITVSEELNIAGKDHVVVGSSYGMITGRGHRVTSASHITVSGLGAKSTNYGEHVHSSGMFDDDLEGGCQNSIFIYKNDLSNFNSSNYISLTLNGNDVAYEKYTLEDNEVLTGTVTITASDANGSDTKVQMTHLALSTNSGNGATNQDVNVTQLANHFPVIGDDTSAIYTLAGIELFINADKELTLQLFPNQLVTHTLPRLSARFDVTSQKY